jgi:hypothetical protein
MTKNLDLLIDEPLELAVALQKLAQRQVKEKEGEDQEWQKFLDATDALVRDLEALNQPSRADDAKSE